MVEPLPLRLRVGQPHTTVIRAREKWNRSGIKVGGGESYHFEASGTWRDLGIRADGDGFPTERVPWVTRWLLEKYESKRRMPGEHWFCLIGSIGNTPGRLFRIGRHSDWVVEA